MLYSTAHITQNINAITQVSGVMPISDDEIFLGSAQTDFALSVRMGVNTRASPNDYFRMADVSEPELGYP